MRPPAEPPPQSEPPPLPSSHRPLRRAAGAAAAAGQPRSTSGEIWPPPRPPGPNRARPAAPPRPRERRLRPAGPQRNSRPDKTLNRRTGRPPRLRPVPVPSDPATGPGLAREFTLGEGGGSLRGSPTRSARRRNSRGRNE